MTNKEAMIQELKQDVSSHNPRADLDLIEKAFNLAYDCHKDQKRNSGEDYIVHPFNVAKILAELHMDTATIVGGLLHDVVEDTDIGLDYIKEEFGTSICHIVDGVTKLTQINFKNKEEKQAENMRKMILAMANDIRVIVVKLSDRLHNMRTLEYMTEEKQKEKAMEVMEIYGPLANRLGISRLQWELEDLALRYLDYDGYYDLVNRVKRKRDEREDIINGFMDQIEEALEDANIEASISGRPKALYSIYKKMHFQNRAFDEIYDLSAVRIMVDDIKDCYGALGVVHSRWKPIPGRFKDYIAMPKSNMYQSLHTTVIDEDGEIFEVQIRTYEMHEIAEYGIAAHWKYKEGRTQEKSGQSDEELTWVRQMLEWQQEQSDPQEYLEGLKVDFFADEVFVFTPGGDVISLSEDSTPIDFAYRIHTEIGHTCVGAKVNGKIVPLNYTLKNGDIVEIITDENSGPSMDWINVVKSSKAKSKIRQYFKLQDKDQNVALGKDLLSSQIKELGFGDVDLIDEKIIEDLVEKFNSQDEEGLYAAIGYGSLSAKNIANTLIDNYQKNIKKTDEEILKENQPKKKPKRSNKLGISVQGESNLSVRLAKCCNPVPGDAIIGFITRGRGVSVHRSDCTNMINLNDPERAIQVEWDYDTSMSYNAEIVVEAVAKGGLLADITNRISDSNLRINSMESKTNADNINITNIVLEIQDIKELNRLIERLKNIENVINVYRVSS